MIIVGCDYHPSFQQIAFVDTETGELKEQRLAHREGAEEFYRALAGTGHRVCGDGGQCWENRDLRQLLWHRHRMVQARTRIMNQLQAVALNEGLLCRKKLWRERGRQQLEAFRLAPWASRRRHDLLELLDRLNPTITELSQAIERCWDADWVIDLDIKAYFDSIPHDLVERAVAHHTDIPWVRLYIARWLRAPVQSRWHSGAADKRHAARWSRKSSVGQSFPPLRIRSLDAAGIPAGPVRALCGRCHRPLQE